MQVNKPLRRLRADCAPLLLHQEAIAHEQG
jgi:hypothetical protein